MKKKLFLVFIAMLALVVCLSFVACNNGGNDEGTGSDTEQNTDGAGALTKEEVAGKYILTSYVANGQELIESAPKATFVFRADGTGVETVDVLDDEYAFEWTLEGDTISLSLSGSNRDPQQLKYENGKLILDTVFSGATLHQEYTRVTE